MVALGELHFVIFAADLSRVIDEDGAVVDVATDTLGATKSQTHPQLFGQVAKAFYLGTTHGHGHFFHTNGRLFTRDELVDHVSFQDAFRPECHLGTAPGRAATKVDLVPRHHQPAVPAAEQPARGAGAERVRPGLFRAGGGARGAARGARRAGRRHHHFFGRLFSVPAWLRNQNFREHALELCVITCLANDVDYSEIYAEQLLVKADAGDLLVVLSGSGNSPNVLKGTQ